jgi:hypothetical protein
MMPTTNAELVDWKGNGVSVERDTLSDGSVVWNVTVEEPRLRIGCTGRAEAEELAQNLSEAAWIESR